MSKPNEEAMVHRCGCYLDAAAVVACVRLMLQRMPSLKALAVPTPSDVVTDADTALLVQLSGVFAAAGRGDCLLKLLLLPNFPQHAPLIKLMPLRSSSEQQEAWRPLQLVGSAASAADVCAALMHMRDTPSSAHPLAFPPPPALRSSPVACDDNSTVTSGGSSNGHSHSSNSANDVLSPQSFEQGQRHIKLLATEVTRMRAEIQVLEGKLALKSGAEGSSVDVNMQQMQAQRRAAVDAHQATIASLRQEVRSLRRTLTDKNKSAAAAPGAGGDVGAGGDAAELRAHLVQEDELVSRLRELNRIVAAASVKRLSQGNGQPALDVRHVIALSNEELERVIGEARRLQPLTGVQRESVRLLVENCRLGLTANDYAEGILKKTLGKLAAGESAPGARNGEVSGVKGGSFSRMCSKW